MSDKAQHAIGFLLTTGIVALGVLGFVAHSQFTKLEDTARLTAHTQDALDSIQSVSLALIDAETGQRGCLLTSQDSYLDPYRSGSAATTLGLARLRNQIASNPDQQSRLERLTALSAQKLAELGQTIVSGWARHLDERRPGGVGGWRYLSSAGSRCAAATRRADWSAAWAAVSTHP